MHWAGADSRQKGDQPESVVPSKEDGQNSLQKPISSNDLLEILNSASSEAKLMPESFLSNECPIFSKFK
jgi:hypothetical protein